MPAHLFERDALISLAQISVIGFERLQPLLSYFGSYSEIWQSDPSDWHVFSSTQISEIKSQKTEVNLQKIYEENQKQNISILTILDPEYPDLLKQISSPPIILYYKGDVRLLHSASLGVVGTRIPSSYGLQAVKKCLPEVILAGLTITSGFQRGIDTAAHQAALQNSGKTIAVLGTGIDVNYPPQNAKLAKQIFETGNLIISEYPLGTPALNYNFPRRNRIISGLSLGVLVVEANIKSGSLITAQFATEQNREVFAIPGSIFDSTSAGPHYLIQQGAKLVTSAQDILDELHLQKSTTPQQTEDYLQNLTTQQAKIYALIRHSSRSIDQLIELTSLDITILSADLTELQLLGLISQMDDGKYINSLNL